MLSEELPEALLRRLKLISYASSPNSNLSLSSFGCNYNKNFNVRTWSFLEFMMSTAVHAVKSVKLCDADLPADLADFIMDIFFF